VVEQPAVNRLVVGSSPTFGAIIWPLGQAVKTPPFHGGNTGSNPVGVTKQFLIYTAKTQIAQAKLGRFQTFLIPCKLTAKPICFLIIE
jgi:hypothetical protein